MKKVLLIALMAAQCDLQAMRIKDKISKILSRKNYVLSTVVREMKNEEKESEDVKKYPKNYRPTSTATSCTAANNDEIFLTDTKQPLSDVTMTSSVEDNGSSAVSDYIYISANPTIYEEVVTSNGTVQSLPNFNSTVPFFEQEGIFDMEMSNTEQLSSLYTSSKKHFPVSTFYREKLNLNAQRRRHSISCEPKRQRRSSIDMYYDKSEAGQKNHDSNSTVPFFEQEGIFDMEMSDAEQSSPGYTLSEEYFSSPYHEKHSHDIQKYRQTKSYNQRRRRRSSIDVYYDKYEADKKKHDSVVQTDSDKEVMTTHGLTIYEEISPKENKKDLVLIFRDKCCDWSFKIIEQKNEIYIGELDSKESLVFCSDVKNAVRNGEGIYILGKSGAEHNVSSWRIPVFGDTPLPFTEQYKNRLEETLLEMVQNPVGAELMHTVITKYNTDCLPKLVFIPVKNVNISLEAGNQLQYFFARYYQDIANYLIMGTRNRFVLYSPECPSFENVRVIKYNPQWDKCMLGTENVPFRVPLFNILLYFLRAHDRQLPIEDSTMKSQPNNARIVVNFNGKELHIPNFWLKIILYGDYEGYRTMFGSTSEKGDKLCEAAYTANEGYIRMSPIDDYYKVAITTGKTSLKLTQNWWDYIFSQYIEQDKDHDLFKHFLTLGGEHLKYVKETLKCSNIDPKTGEKIS